MCLYLQAQAMKRTLSEIYLLATQKCGHFFNYFLFTLARVSRRVPYKFSKLSARVRRRALSKEHPTNREIHKNRYFFIKKPLIRFFDYFYLILLHIKYYLKFLFFESHILIERLLLSLINLINYLIDLQLIG